MTDALQPLSAFIAQLEAAEAGSRELDAHVEVAARLVEASRTGLKPEHWAKWAVSRDFWVEDSHTAYKPKPHTTSLDAALALAERMLGEKEAMYALAEIINAEGALDDLDTVSARDLPRLLCIAILKARVADSASGSNGGEGA